MLKICLICQKKFYCLKPFQKYCSKKCRTKRNNTSIKEYLKRYYNEYFRRNKDKILDKASIKRAIEKEKRIWNRLVLKGLMGTDKTRLYKTKQERINDLLKKKGGL